MSSEETYVNVKNVYLQNLCNLYNCIAVHRLSCVGRLTPIERGVQGLELVDLEHAPLDGGSILCLLKNRAKNT